MSERRRVYLLRHGQADYMRSGAGAPTVDPPLSAEGVAQMEHLRELLSELPLDLAAATELRRTQQTAELALGDRNLPIEVLPGLSEAKAGSPESARNAEELQNVIIGAFDGAEAPGARFLGGETYASVRARATREFQNLIARSDWRCALVAGHGVVNRTILAHALGAGPEIYKRLEQDAGCVNVLDIDGKGEDARVAYVRLINFTPYNATKSGLTETSLEMLWRRLREAGL